MLRPALNSVAHLFGFHVSRHRRDRDNLPSFVDPAFLALYRSIRHATMTTWTGCYQTWHAARYAAGVPGDVVECGVYKGGLSILMAAVTGKPVWMYDTFSGMTEPGVMDVARHDGKAAAQWMRESEKVRAIGPVETVLRNITESGLPQERFILIQGPVEDTIPSKAPAKISLLRLDTDWYQSTRHELEHLFPRLSPGGVLIVDDYGIWDGARQATDEYISGRGLVPLAQDTEYGALVCVKPA